MNQDFSKTPSIPSIIKWTGSKRKQAGTICKYIPPHERYVEPFLGSGAVLFFHTANALASDIYEPLIRFWKQVQENPLELALDYKDQWEKLQKDTPRYFYTVRERFNRSKDPNDLNFLLRTCVNGIVRFNEKGEFNNSFHLSRKGMRPERFQKNLMIWHNRLKNVRFECCDYETTLEKCKKDDFVYMDPPYAGSRNRYTDNLDIQRFLENLDSLNRKSVKWALSFDGYRGPENLSFDIPGELYKRKILISNGHSAVNQVLNRQLEAVRESLYLNY